MEVEIKDLVFGKSDITRVIGCEVTDTEVHLFIQNKLGELETITKPFKWWILSDRNLSPKWTLLAGGLHFKYLRDLDSEKEFLTLRNRLRGMDHFVCNNKKEQAMVRHGFTYFKDIEPIEIPTLAFDIETTGLYHNAEAKVLLISNTFRKNQYVERKLFSIDEYESQKEMIDAWTEWVRQVNPAILLGHNIYSFDLPYLNFVAERAKTSLKLGRDGSPTKFNNYESKFRKDQSQNFIYKEAKIFGREIVDTLFLSIKYDVAAKKYDSYGLKNIIKQEKLEKPNRTFYDASKIRDNYNDPVEMEKIKAYCIDDADDALALFDLMIPAQFYFNRSVPKPLQMVINSATGSPINSILVRSYLQHGHSIPKADLKKKYPGAISFGAAGIYKNCIKWDVASLYPSIILSYKIWDRAKDPKEHFYKMVEYFTEERLHNKKLASELNSKHHKDLSESQKIVVNSAYGLLGASGLCFNSPANARLVAEKGRDILKSAIKWATGKDYEIDEEKEEDESV